MRIYDCGEDKQAKVRCIFSHLTLPVPRSGWERAPKTGHLGEAVTTRTTSDVVYENKIWCENPNVISNTSPGKYMGTVIFPFSHAHYFRKMA